MECNIVCVSCSVLINIITPILAVEYAVITGVSRGWNLSRVLLTISRYRFSLLLLGLFTSGSSRALRRRTVLKAFSATLVLDTQINTQARQNDKIQTLRYIMFNTHFEYKLLDDAKSETNTL